MRRAFESVPWVRHAVVRRVWPNRLRVQLEEHRPVALWGGETGSEKLVNSFGEVFEANLGDVEDDDLPRLVGPDGSSAQVLAMLGRIDERDRAARRAHRDAGALEPRLVAGDARQPAPCSSSAAAATTTWWRARRASSRRSAR